MKFVVNRVHEPSRWNEHLLQGNEFLFNDNFVKSFDIGYCAGDVVGDFHGIPFCESFTVAEVPDTEEGYYLL